MQALALGRFEQRDQIPFAFEVSRKVSGKERSRRPGLAGHRPVGPQFQQQLVVERAHLRIGRLLDLHPIVAATNILFTGEKSDASRDKFVGVPMIVDDPGIHAHVFVLSFENDFRLRQRRAPLPFLDDSRVAGAGQGIRAEISSHVKRIPVAPIDFTLGLRQIKSICHECLRGQIEFAHDFSIGAAPR